MRTGSPGRHACALEFGVVLYYNIPVVCSILNIGDKGGNMQRLQNQ